MSMAIWLSQAGAVPSAPADAPLLALLDWKPALWHSQPWRLWSAAMVHWSGAHLGINLLACAALIAWGNAAALGWRQTLAWLAAWPVTHMLLATDPSMLRYGGMSGLLHAGVAVGGWTLAWRGQGPRRLIGILVLAGLLIKQVLEVPVLAHAFGFDPLVLASAVPGAPQFQVASYGHLCGVLAGLLCAAAADLKSCFSTAQVGKQ
jgi:hypothetical protein